jgi:hypothetical protein
VSSAQALGSERLPRNKEIPTNFKRPILKGTTLKGTTLKGTISKDTISKGILIHTRAGWLHTAALQCSPRIGRAHTLVEAQGNHNASAQPPI